MPVYNLPKNPYEETIDRIPVIGKLINDYILGRTPEEQIMGAVGMNVNPARKPAQAILKKTRADKTLSKILGDEAMLVAEDNTKGAFSGLWDKQVRKTISDDPAKFKVEAGMKRLPGGRTMQSTTIHAGKMGDILDHPELFEYYPELKDFTTTVKVDRFAKKPHKGYIIKDRNISVEGQDPENSMFSLLHEIQHWIQMKEGTWGQGANSSNIPRDIVLSEKDKLMKSTFTDPKTLAPMVKTPIGDFPFDKAGKVAEYLAYWKHAGEAEARDISEKWLAKKHMGKSWWNDSPLSSQPIDDISELIVNTLE